MKPTLLELVQRVLTEINGDEVNSITDTEEAEQVAGHIKAVYNNMLSSGTWPHTRRTIVITPYSDTNYPTHFVVDDNVKEVLSISYNTADLGETRRRYTTMKYKDPDSFLRLLNSRNSDDADVDIVIDNTGIELLILNDKNPEYYTSFNDKDLVFDSYNSEVEATLQQSKVQAQGYIIPALLIADDTEIDLPIDAFSALLEESIARVQFKMREFQDVKSERESFKQRSNMSRKNWLVNGGIKYPNYGRGSSRWSQTNLLKKD